MYLYALLSHVMLSTAAWTTASSYSIHPHSTAGRVRRYRKQLPTLSKAQALFTNAALTSTAASKSKSKLFAKAAENSPLLQPQQQHLNQKDGNRLWKLFTIRGGSSEAFRWTPVLIAKALALFVMSGIAEIGGGWMVWNAVREGKPWWWALIGSLVMVVYAFLPTLQPTDSFGRIYAVYGGFFIGLSYIWGMLFDGMKPDKGDVIGSCLALLAVLIIQYWPRSQ